MLRTLRMGTFPKCGSEARDRYAELLALQFVRTPDRLVLNRLPQLARERMGRDGVLDDNNVREVFRDHVGRDPISDEAAGLKAFLQLSLQDAWAMGLTDVMTSMFLPAADIAAHFSDLTWTVERTRGLKFITSDTPVHLWCRNPPTRLGVGLNNSDEIRFPIGPVHLLVMRRGGADGSLLVKRGRVGAVNRHIAATCWQTVVSQPEQVASLSEVSLRPVRPVLLVRTQEGVQRASGEDERRVELLHSYRPYDDGTAAG